jgi:hypothetical protein
MAGLTVTFGNGGAPTLQSLDAQNHIALDSATEKQEVTDQNGSSLQSGSVAVDGAPVGGSGTGGNVNVSFDAATNSFNFDVAGKWNSVKNVLAESDSAENVHFRDFVQADVHLGGTTGSTVEILNVKRSNVSTGSGNDTVTISLLSNDKGWVNAATVDTGDGNDTITIKAGQALSTIGGISGASAVNNGNGITDGSNSSVIINAGAGDDKIDLSGVNLKSSTVIGGTGIDHMVASGGADTFVFKLGDMAASFATDVIQGFNASVDRIKVEGTTADDWTVDHLKGDTILSYNGAEAAHHDETIILKGNIAQDIHSWFTV